MSSITEATAFPRPIAPKTDPANRPMRKDAARNRELLVASARVVFAQHGMAASLDDVARHAGLGVGTAYRHFANKYDLLSAMMDQIIDGVIARAEQSLTIADPWLALETFIEGVLEAQVNDRGLREVMIGYHDPAKFDETHDRISALLTELLGRAQAAGVVRADAESSDVGMIVTMLCSAADIATDEAPRLWRRYLALCLEGLRPADSPLPERALTETEMRAAMMAHKQVVDRSSC